MIKIRASAISDFLDCPARAEAKHLLHKRMPMGAPAALGVAVHASTALFDQSKLDGNPVTAAESAGAAVDSMRKPREDVDWSEDDIDKAERIAIGLHTKYCETIAPSRDYAAVEVRCDSLEITDLGIALEGSTDRVRRSGDGYGISDLKTGKTAVSADGVVSTKGHAYQIGVYELLAEHASGLAIDAPAEIVGLNVGVKPETQRVATAPIAGAREVLLGDAEQPGILQAVAAMINSGNFFGNPRSQLCHVKYCPIYETCRYRK